MQGREMVVYNIDKGAPKGFSPGEGMRLRRIRMVRETITYRNCKLSWKGLRYEGGMW